MKLITPVDLQQHSTKISYMDRGFAIGSCFATEMGTILSGLKFKIDVNPMGVLYNVASIASTLERISSRTLISSDTLFAQNSRYHSYQAHSIFSSEDRDVCAESINSAIQSSHKSFSGASYIIVTLGTSYIYRLKSSAEVVANCHKSPAKIFDRERLTIEQTISYLERVVKLCSGKRVIFTVSPIRHIKDGLSENNLSKSILRVAIQEMVDRYSSVSYFPSYEIMMDELRDYRFYGEDMLHPSPLAVKYIWQKFQSNYCASETIALSKRVAEIAKRLSHRAINPNSQEHHKFMLSTLDKIYTLEKESPHIDFKYEREVINQALR